MKKLAGAVAATCFLAAAGAANASVSYVYVGSWQVDSGPVWSATNASGHPTTLIYSGDDAAAAIFGGSASDYVTSTVDASVADINFDAWYDGWGQRATIFADTFRGDPMGLGLYNDPKGSFGTASFVPTWSAYVRDHGVSNVNYAFRVIPDAAIPEPGTIALFGIALAAIAVSRRKQKN